VNPCTFWSNILTVQKKGLIKQKKVPCKYSRKKQFKEQEIFYFSEEKTPEWYWKKQS
jgi:hypothetical protein